MKDEFRWHYWPEEKPQDESIQYILCVSGKRGSCANIIYDHGVVADAYYEDGRWFLGACAADGMEVHAWMPYPDPPQRGEKG